MDSVIYFILWFGELKPQQKQKLLKYIYNKLGWELLQRDLQKALKTSSKTKIGRIWARKKRLDDAVSAIEKDISEGLFLGPAPKPPFGKCLCCGK